MGQLKQTHVNRVLGLLEGRNGGSQKVSFDEVMELASVSAESFQETIGAVDSNAYGALAAIGAEIDSMKTEISKLQIQDMRQNRIPEAGHELDAIVEATEEATNTIMEAAEAMMAADPSDPEAYTALVSDKVVEIFEACSFQDITGQRISKVVRTIDIIDKRISAFVEHLRLINGTLQDADDVPESDEERRARELILHGPQLKGDGVDQNDVDAMMNDDSGSAQSAIDDLFK